jgi:hypothetical protein
MIEITDECEERADNDCICKCTIRAKRMELQYHLFWRRTALGNIGMPDEKRLPRRRREWGTPASL